MADRRPRQGLEGLNDDAETSTAQTIGDGGHQDLRETPTSFQREYVELKARILLQPEAASADGREGALRRSLADVSEVSQLELRPSVRDECDSAAAVDDGLLTARHALALAEVACRGVDMLMTKELGAAAPAPWTTVTFDMSLGDLPADVGSDGAICAMRPQVAA
ncbi:MAG: hypothetical protein ACKPKO_15220, partial [Candidatus Fonsibacter sp.]